MSLAKALSAPSTAGLRLHTGKVASIQTGSISVEFSGNTTATPNVRYLSTYAPQVGDYVMALHTGPPRSQGGGDWLVLGTVGATRPIFRGYVGSAYTLLTTGYQKLPLSVASIDTAAGFSSANNWYVVPTAGYYQVSAALTGGAANPNILAVSVYQNGALASQAGQIVAGTSSNYGLTLSDILTCAAGDTLALWVYSTSGGTLNIGAAYNYLAISPA